MPPIHLDPDVPLYRQIADALRAAIAEGAYPPGSPLPTENDLANEFGVGRDTLRDALDVLKAEGLVLKRRGQTATVAVRKEPKLIHLSGHDRAICRPATPEERYQLGLPNAGCHIVEIKRRGRAPEVHPAAEVMLTGSPVR